MNAQTFSAGRRRIVFNRCAAIQRGVNISSIKSCVRGNADQLTTSAGGLLILEDTLRQPGYDPVTEITPDMEVRYARDPNSRAKRHNQQPVPFALAPPNMEMTDEFTVYVMRINNVLNVVRAHYGKPYPPFPFSCSAESWPGYVDPKDEATVGAGIAGCKEFWRECALWSSSRKRFAQMSTIKPDWLS